MLFLEPWSNLCKQTSMLRPYTQSRSCANIDGESYIVPIIGDVDGLLRVTERAYTYLLRNANPRLLPSQFRRETVDQVFLFMIERLRRARNTNTAQVMKYGVEKYLALLKDVESKVRYELSTLPRNVPIAIFLLMSGPCWIWADQLPQWKSCASWSSSLVFELQFQFPLNYPDITPRETGPTWSFHYISADGQKTCYDLPVLRIIDASVQGQEWALRFSRANPGLGGTVPPDLVRVAFENYICRIVPKPRSIMRSIFFEQVS